MTAETIPLWVCVDCYMAYHEGDYTPTEQATPWALFDLADGAPTIHSQVTPGLMFGEDNCPHTAADRDDEAAMTAHAEDCERKTFTWSRCDGCGSTLAGERQAMTQWIEPVRDLTTQDPS